MKKLAFAVLALIFLGVNLVSAHTEETFTQAQEIIRQKTSCSELTEEQLEILGDYFMEQMHPDESHEIMDERMGGEGSESLKQAHINMGRIFYCGQTNTFSSGMMNTMMGRGMMGYGRMTGNTNYKNSIK